MLAVAPRLFIPPLCRRAQTAKSDRKYKNKTNTGSEHKETDSFTALLSVPYLSVLSNQPVL